MRLILSRKGFDSACGGVASPIFPDCCLASLPIPMAGEPVAYGAIRWGAGTLGPIVEQLTRGRFGPGSAAHLDPDLDPDALPRAPGWRPAFGQLGAAQTHLDWQGVGEGDLFLFFGWFRAVEPGPDGRWRHRRDAPDRHVIFGWLQVGEALRVGRDAVAARRAHPWLAYHPHLQGRREANNTVYIARERLSLPGAPHGLPGGGTFRHLTEAQVLSAPGQPLRSLWRLPSWLHPGLGLSYNTDPARWREDGHGWRLRAADQGQEFVTDLAGSDEAACARWLGRLFG